MDVGLDYHVYMNYSPMCSAAYRKYLLDQFICNAVEFVHTEWIVIRVYGYEHTYALWQLSERMSIPILWPLLHEYMPLFVLNYVGDQRLMLMF